MKQLFKEKFESIYKSTNNKASSDYRIFYNSKKNRLDLLNKIETYESELKKIDNLISQNPHPYYCEYFNNSDLLFYQFYNRGLLLKTDESDELRESIYLGFYRHKIRKALVSLSKLIPEFTFQMYQQDLECPFLNSGHDWYNISEKDYYDIMKSKVMSLSQIVELTSNILIYDIQDYLSTVKNPMDIIKQQLLIFKNELDGFKSKNLSIKTIFSKLIIFRNIDINDFEENKLKQSYEIFKGKVPLKNITKDFLNFFNSITESTGTIPIDHLTIFFVINRVRIWLNTIIEGARIEEPFELNESLTEFIMKLIENSYNQADKIIADIKNSSPISEESRIDYYKHHFDNYRTKYNQFENESWFNLISEGEEPILLYYINIIITQVDIMGHSKLFHDALIIQRVLSSLTLLLDEFKETKELDFLSISESCSSTNSILQDIVFNKEIFLKKQQIELELYKNHDSNYLPLEFHVRNFALKLIELFKLVIENFSNIFDELEPSEKGYYIFEKIKELKRSNLNLDSFDSKKLNQKGVTNYKETFLDFFEIEAQYIRDMNASNFNPLLSINNTTEKSITIINSFYYKHYNSRLSQLTDMMTFLIKNQFISEHTTIVNFRKVFNKNHIETKIIWTKSATEFSYFIKYLHNIAKKIENLKQKHWSVAVECFVMKNNVPFDQKKLRTLKKPANFELIENAVNLI